MKMNWHTFADKNLTITRNIPQRCSGASSFLEIWCKLYVSAYGFVSKELISAMGTRKLIKSDYFGSENYCSLLPHLGGLKSNKIFG